MKRSRVRHVFLLTSGWSVLAAGLLVLPVPVPMPVPVAFPLMLTGAVILTAHSRGFRHAVQHARHRFGWFSRGLENIAEHAPESAGSRTSATVR